MINRCAADLEKDHKEQFAQLVDVDIISRRWLIWPDKQPLVFHLHMGHATYRPTTPVFHSVRDRNCRFHSRQARKGCDIQTITKPMGIACGVSEEEGSEYIDYCKIYSVTRKVAYLIPRSDDTLDILAGSWWFSNLDMVSGYWHVEVRLENERKQQFVICQSHATWFM